MGPAGSSSTDQMGEYAAEARPRARKALRQLDPVARRDILTAMRALGTEPRPAGVKPLKGYRPWLRVRVGDYRIIYDVNDTTRTVTVAGHRREVYRGLDL
jgi:mRNA interferase RelE/StbE